MAKKAKGNLKKTKVSKKKQLLYIQHPADPLFSFASHPTEPIFVTGSATGRVQAYRYNIEELKEVRKDFDGEPYIISCLQNDDFLDDTIDILWQTKRHKGSCRDMKFDLPSKGGKIHTIGSEGVIKTADLITGKVINKYSHNIDNEELKMTKCSSTPGKEFLIVGDENGGLRCHDTRSKNLQLAFKNFKDLHNGEGINSINFKWPKSDYKIITTGSTTVCELDLRKPEAPVRESEDQEDEVLGAVWVDQERQDTMVCGMGEGIVTVWKPEINKWEDQYSRVKISKGESIDCLVSAMDSQGKYIWAGSSDGSINKVDINQSKVIEHLLQNDPENKDMVDEVTGLDLDYEYRLVSCGMDGLTLWDDENGEEEENSDEEDNNDSIDEDSDEDSDSGFDKNDSDSDLEEEKSEIEDKVEDEEEKEEEEEEEKTTARASIKRRFAELNKGDSEDDSNDDSHDHSEEESGEDIPDSDDEQELSTARTVKLGDIRDKLLAELDAPIEDDDKPRKLTKKQKRMLEKKQKGPGPEHGIRKFDDL